MRFIHGFLSVWIVSCLVFPPQAAVACTHGSCSLSRAGGRDNPISSGAMINSPTASTLGKHKTAAGFTFDHTQYHAFEAGDAHNLHHKGQHVHGKNHEEAYSLDLGFGALEDLDLYLSAPIVNKSSIEVHSHRFLGDKENATGFGDMRLLSKYRFWDQGVEAAFLTGIKFPTGRTTVEKADGAEFDAENQPGSGAWDYEFGLAVSRSFMRRLSAATSFQYLLRNEGAMEFEAGDTFRYNIGLAYALRELGRHPNLSISLELNNEWSLKDHSREARRVEGSGGEQFFLTPGLSADVTEHVSAFIGMPIPISQNLGGEHEETKYKLMTGMTWMF